MDAVTSCPSCGTELRPTAKFCDHCGAPIASAAGAAEYKQVTVLFADVVHSMDIAVSVDAERLREIMADLVNRCATVITRYGGTVDKFTGDGVMAVFGAPVALEGHAFHACLAALEVQKEVTRLAAAIALPDGLQLQVRVGLDSGRVVVGKLGSGPMGYTAVGEHVGMAERMESIAPAGAVMVSESTARLVEDVAVLGERELVHIKGVADPVPARRLLSVEALHGPIGREESTLVGRRWELAVLDGILDQAVDGRGCVVTVMGPSGIGKSRLVRELMSTARSRGIEVFWTSCQAYTRGIPFYAAAALLRAALDVTDRDAAVARQQVRARIPDANPEDMLLLDDLLGIADPDVELPRIDPDARRRRLTALVDAVSVARKAPAVYVVEDVHWIDEVSELMLAGFLAVIPQTHAMAVFDYRPEYHGALTHAHNAQMITLAPLSASLSAALIAELLGPDPSVANLAGRIAERAAGNPFFIEEIVRELAERGVLNGTRGNYLCHLDVAEVSVPATLEATIASRIDRLTPPAKRTLCAAAVIGSPFDAELLTSLGVEPSFGELLDVQLIDQVMFVPRAEYAIRHPMIRTVAYESQLKSDRTRLHRRLAAAIEARDPQSCEENAALIAGHLEAAGDLAAAYSWRMRAGMWSWNRDLVAATTNWQQALAVADRLPGDDPGRIAMRIAPLAQLCATGWRMGRSVADSGFDELRELCAAAGDKVSLAIAMLGQLMELTIRAHHREAARLATEYVNLLEAINDPAITVGLFHGAIMATYEAGEWTEALRLCERVIDLAGGDPAKGNLVFGSPLAMATGVQGLIECFLGRPGWKERMDSAVVLGRTADAFVHVVTVMFKYVTVADGALLADSSAVRETAEALATAEQFGDDFTLALARFAHGIVLVHRGGPDRDRGVRLLGAVGAVTVAAELLADAEIANEKARTGDVDGAIEMAQAVVDRQFDTAAMMFRGRTTTVLVEALLRRGTDADLRQARAAVERLAAVDTEPALVVHELALLRLRARLARAHGEQADYRALADRYRARAASLGFQGQLAVAAAMT